MPSNLNLVDQGYLDGQDRKTYAGYHAFPDEEGEHGSFEVFYQDYGQKGGEDQPLCAGWYWWPCFPGCLPDGEANGPFPTAEGAYLDAIDE